MLTDCAVCPRQCRVDRRAEPGSCATGADALVASYNLHFGEEPVISGRRGSGTVFLAYPWSYSRYDTIPDKPHVHYLSERYSAHNGYEFGQGAVQMYPFTGASKDLAYAWGSLTWSIEIHNTKWPDASEIVPTFEENRDAILELWHQAGKGIHGTVTGAAGVLYGSISRALAANGVKVALLDILGDKVNEIAEEIRAEGGEAIGVECSVLDVDSLKGALDTILQRLGGCDALINGAGGNRKGACVPADGNFTDLDLDEFDKVFQLNYRGTVLPTQVFCKHFAEEGKGLLHKKHI